MNVTGGPDSRQMIALVLLPPDHPNAAPFRAAISSDDALSRSVELRFAGRGSESSELGAAEVIACGNLAPEQAAAACSLRWVSYFSAGLDGKLTAPLVERGIRITSSSGVHAANIAEHVLMLMLMFSRRMPFFFRAQVEAEWRRTPPGREPGELRGQTLGIVGFGHIGRALAERASALGMRVVATRRRPAPVKLSSAPSSASHAAANVPERKAGIRSSAREQAHPSPAFPAASGAGSRSAEAGAHSMGSGQEACAAELLPSDGLYGLLAQSDHVCISAPLTPETLHMIDHRALAHMKASAFLYNISRGKLVDEAALVEALETGRLAGAGLDVFENEPLPASSPLWRLPDVIITPHVSGVTPHYFERAAELFAGNLRRYLGGQPLQNQFNSQLGY